MRRLPLALARGVEFFERLMEQAKPALRASSLRPIRWPSRRAMHHFPNGRASLEMQDLFLGIGQGGQCFDIWGLPRPRALATAVKVTSNRPFHERQTAANASRIGPSMTRHSSGMRGAKFRVNDG